MLSPKEFVEHNLEQLEKYINEVSTGSIIVNKFERLSVERFQKLRKQYHYNQPAVERVLKFFSLLNLPVKNEVKQIQLLPFQIFWIANLYGLESNLGIRLFNEAYIEIAKKNGKSSFFAGLSIYEAIGDNELNANCLLVASSRDQAKVALNYIINILENSPAINDLFVVNKNVVYNKTASELNKIEVRASDAGKIMGLNTSFNLTDEYAFHKNSELKDKIKSGMIARKNHLQVSITTACNDVMSPAYALRQSAVNVLEGQIANDSLFVQLFTLDDKTEIEKPECWRKSNPALGLIFDLDDLKKEYDSAKHLPSKLNTFITDNLNVWIQNLSEKWIADDVIVGRLKENKQIPDGADVYVGYDGSATRDLTSISIVHFDKSSDEFITKVIYVFPSNPTKKIKQGSINLQYWIDDKFIVETPQPVIDDETIIDIFSTLKNQYNIISVGYDAFNSRGLFQKIENQLGLPTNIVSQKITSLNYPTRFLESLIYREKISFDKNPVTRWNFQNVKPYFDANNNIKLLKHKSEAIDGIISTVMALSEWLAYNENATIDFLSKFQSAMMVK